MKHIVYILMTVVLFLLWFLRAQPPLLNDVSFSQVFYADNQQLLRITLTSDEKYRAYTPLAQLPQNFIDATLLKEDKYFYYHPGVNLSALIRAFWQTYILRHKRIGGSTITMQVARLKYHLDTRTFLGKLKQIGLALKLEHDYSKKEILEAYFNLAPYGNNIEGAGTASLVYFHEPIQKLLLPEALFLSVLPQSPAARKVSPATQAALMFARQQLFDTWEIKHPEDVKLQPLFDLPPNLYTLQSLPFLAPHFVNHILTLQPEAHTLQTTLNLRWQQLVEKTIQRYISAKQTVGIHNAAVLLVDTRNMDVKVLVGSANFFDNNLQGQVDGTHAKRSPGSTLKPFIYALALDQGIIHPGTVLKDAPTSFGSYDPENFDHTFLGPINATEALTLSRNIPAIYLASLLKRPSLYDFLRATDLPLKSENTYGLSLVLGGAEVSLHNMTKLYAMLANAGVYHELHFLANQPLTSGKTLLSPEASFLTLDMLKQNPRPPAFAFLGSQAVAWKTGTASGFRDATTIGVVGPYVLAVWIGNFNGSPNPAFTGINAAAPLFFNIIETLKPSIGDLTPQFAKPVADLNLTQVQVCRASGLLPNRFCPQTIPSWFIPGKSPIKKDTIYREIMVDPKTHLRSCHINPHNQYAVYEFWPSDLLQIFQAAGIPRRSPPAYAPDCEQTRLYDKDHTPPAITSPQQNTTYAIKAETAVVLSAVSDADVKQLHWFVNQQYLGARARNSSVLWRPTLAGHYVIRVVDDDGQTDVRDVHVVSIA